MSAKGREPASRAAHLPPSTAQVGGLEKTGPPRVNCLNGFLEKNSASVGKKALQREPSLCEIKRRASARGKTFST